MYSKLTHPEILFPIIWQLKMEQKNNRYFFIMRLFIAIMLPIVLSLSMLPCCPPLESCPDEVSHSGTDGPTQGALPSSGLCSPFYTCGHCPGFILQQVVFPPLTFREVNETISGNRPEFKPFSLVKLFFKPPKV